MTIYVPTAVGNAFLDGRVKSAIIRPRKSIPTTGVPLTISSGGWGNATVLGSVICRAVRYVTRVGPMHWAYGVIGNRQTLSNLDLRQLSADCGYASPSELDEKWRTHPADKPLLLVTFR